MRIRFRELLERVRDSQFLIPAVLIGLSLVLVAATGELDRRDAIHPPAVESSVTAARTLLATVAGAVITVAALVFSLSAVTIQLASSQYSPRVVQGFLRDRKQQLAVGVAMGTFTYALVALATLPAATPSLRADWTVSIAVVLAVLTAIGLVAYIDHITRRVRIDDTVRRIALRTQAAFAPRVAEPGPGDESWDLTAFPDPATVRATEAGFVQEIDAGALADLLPPGTVARLDVWTGHFVNEGRRLVTIWGDEAFTGAEAVPRAFAIGDQRTIDQDPGFGIRQLVDIALRALSPGVNDPATAADVVRHLSGCMRAAHFAGDTNRVFHGAAGARLLAPHAPTVGDHVVTAFAPIRRAAADQPLVLEAIVDALNGLDDELTELRRDASAIRREAAAAAEQLEMAGGDAAGTGISR